jgi:hypothetical protein
MRDPQTVDLQAFAISQPAIRPRRSAKVRHGAPLRRRACVRRLRRPVAAGALCRPCSLLARAEHAFTREEALCGDARMGGRDGRAATFGRLDGRRSSAVWRSARRSTRAFPRCHGRASVRNLGNGATGGRLHAAAPAWAEDAVIEALRRDARRRGRPPYYAPVAWATDHTPGHSTAVAMFGTWRAALAAAGLALPTPHPLHRARAG